MPANTSPDNLSYPVEGDNIAPLQTWFATLAGNVQAALTALRAEAVQPELPFPQTVVGNSVQAITSTAWADLAGISAITLTLTRPAWVQIDVGAWMVAAAGDSRVSVQVSGATSLSESQTEVGGGAGAWGQVIYAAAAAGTRQQTLTRTVRLNAGTNTIKVRAYRTGGSNTQNFANYSTMTVAPLRWA